MFEQANNALDSSTIQKSKTLPLKPAESVLNGQFVTLRPLVINEDVRELHAVSNGQPFALNGRSQEAYDADLKIWRYMSGGPFASEKQLADFLKPQIDAQNGLCFCVVDRESNHPIGVCNLMNNFPEHLKIELGNIWYGPIAQGTQANLESTYLMLKHAFELGYRRVEWKCDSLNERSRKSALRMGFQFEGIQEQHFIVKERNRDTAWYRILDHDWARVEDSLKELLAKTP